MQGSEKEKGRLGAMKIFFRIATAIVLVFVMLGAIFLGVTNMSSSETVLPTVTTNAGEAPKITAPSGTPPMELTASDVIVGTGAEVLPSSTLTLHYTLMVWSTGEIIESSWDGGSPATFVLSTLVEGWKKGLPGAQVGGRRLLILPPELGYGASGSGPIGPNETLVFAIDILGVS